MVSCIECGADVTAPANVETGEIIDCGTCGVELEVLQTGPIEFDLAPELAEDWGE